VGSFFVSRENHIEFFDYLEYTRPSFTNLNNIIWQKEVPALVQKRSQKTLTKQRSVLQSKKCCLQKRLLKNNSIKTTPNGWFLYGNRVVKCYIYQMKNNFYHIIFLCALGGLLLGLLAPLLGNSVLGTNILIGTLSIGTAPLLWKMLKNIIKGRIGVDIIAIVAIVTSFILGQYITGVIVLVMLSGGEALEVYALKRARKELSSLISNAPTFAHKKEHNTIRDVLIAEIQIGDTILIKPGEIVAADGMVSYGKSQVDESSITGESLPVSKEVGGMVFSGSINKGAALEVTVFKLPSESKYEQIITLVKQAEKNRAPLVRAADTYSLWFTIITFVLALLTWILSKDAVRVLAVLVVATPCPLIIATPIAMIGGISKSAKRGIIVKSGGALETLAKTNAFIFDKTGTLTLGQPDIVSIISLGAPESSVLKYSASLDQLSMHSLARSLTSYASKNNVPLLIPSNFKESFGEGVSGEIDGKTLFFGKLPFIKGQGLVVPNTIDIAHKNFEEQGQIAVYYSDTSTILGIVVFADSIRPETKNLFKNLKKQGLSNIAMVTGDKKSVADRIAQELGIDDVRAEALPEDKVIAIKDYKKQFGTVAMIGDGINDAPALAMADVGIALGGHGGSASSESSDIVIMVDDVGRVAEAYSIAKKTLRIATQGILFGIGASVFLMIVASLGYVSPTYGALAQEGLDVIVILNALRINFGGIA
jgi:heavy metal translocating P-type ATPase